MKFWEIARAQNAVFFRTRTRLDGEIFNPNKVRELSRGKHTIKEHGQREVECDSDSGCKVKKCNWLRCLGAEKI